MRIVVLGSPGGEALRRTMFATVAALRDVHELRVFAAERDAHALRTLDVPVESWRPVGPFGVLRSLGALRRALDREPPDAIHVFGWSAAVVALGSLPPRVAARSLVTLCGPVTKDDLPRGVVNVRLAGMLARAGAFAVGYDALRRGLIEAFGVDPARIEVVPFPAEPVTALVPERPRERLGPVCGYIGLLEPDAGWEDAIAALAAARARLPDARLWLSSDGPLKGLVKQVARSAGVSDAVTAFDALPPSALLDGVDLVLVPRSRDTLPYAVVDALVTGVPVVTARTPGTDDALGPYPTGYLAPPDPAGLAAGIEAAWREIDAARAGALEQAPLAAAARAPGHIAERISGLYARCATLGPHEEVDPALDASGPAT